MAKQKILLIEDEHLVSRPLARALAAEGLEVLTANDGQKGLDLIESEKPDLVLLDLRMPVMDGLTMLRTLHNDHGGVQMPVVVLTNVVDIEADPEELKQLGVKRTIVKADTRLSSIIGEVKEILG